MRTILRLLPTALLLAIGMLAAEHGESHDSHASIDLWKSVNFVLLAAGLGWLMHKFLGKYFRQRTEDIQQGIVGARKEREEAEARAAEMDRRMANLESEIAGLKTSASEEMAAEEARLKRETEQLIARLGANAEQEIASAAKHARKELRAYATELALKLAHQKIRDRMTPELADSLMDSFTDDLRELPQRVK